MLCICDTFSILTPQISTAAHQQFMLWPSDTLKERVLCFFFKNKFYFCPSGTPLHDFYSQSGILENQFFSLCLKCFSLIADIM